MPCGTGRETEAKVVQVFGQKPEKEPVRLNVSDQSPPLGIKPVSLLCLLLNSHEDM